MSDVLWIDYEAQSDVKIKAAGIYKYSRSPHTRLICASLAMNKEPARHWNPRLPFPEDVARHIRRGGKVRAHNAVTERLLTNHVGHRLYGIPKMTIEQMECTMVRCGATALPLALEMAAVALKLPVRKDMEKQKSMKKIWAPLSIDPITGEPVFATPETHPKEFQDTYDYNLTDLEVMREVTRYTKKLSPFERKVYIIDQKINDRGVLIDMENVKVLKRLAAKEKTRLNEELAPLCGLKASQNVKLVAWIREQGVPCKSLNKHAVARLLADVFLPDRVRRVIEIRQEAAKASLAKLPAMERRCESDNRARGCFQMMGAVSTGRWAHRDPQFGNIPRPALTPWMIERILEWAKTCKPQDDMETLDTIRTIWGRPMSVFSDCLRGLLIPAPGKVLIGPDLVSIESLVSAWLVGDDDKVKFMAGGGKVYEAVARLILGLAPFRGWTDDGPPVTKLQRQLYGKVPELACGYQGGPKPEGAVGKFCEAAGVPYPGIKEAKRWVDVWREYHPHHVAYWTAINRAAIQAVLEPGTRPEIGPPGRRVAFYMEGRFLRCHLPSGSVLSYPYPRVESGKFGPVMTYMKAKGKMWFRNHYFGGHGLENVVQRVSRDLLAWAMVNLEAAGFRVITHSHDEGVVETARRSARAKISEIFGQRPDWAATLPYTSSDFMALRYQK
jgi:DNA polymerase